MTPATPQRAAAANWPVVQPLAVFAAGRGSFDALVRSLAPPKDALALIFAELPMQENGWAFDRTNIEKVRQRYGFPVYRVNLE